jgi:hypothetical protein
VTPLFFLGVSPSFKKSVAQDLVGRTGASAEFSATFGPAGGSIGAKAGAGLVPGFSIKYAPNIPK